jgi:hypothetical protein
MEPTQWIIVTGSLLSGVEQVYGPFDGEQAAREWAMGNSDADLFALVMVLAAAERTD